MTKKKESKLRQKINEIYEQNELANLESNKSRARSITVGTAFGGAVEISMRGDYYHLWTVMQPVEAVEIIEQLASGIGLQIAMRPRQDFATWRGWNVESENRYWAGAAEWQIEQASMTHKKFLKDEIEELKLLMSSENNLNEDVKKIPRKKASTKKINTKQRIKDDLENQKKISENLHKDPIEKLMSTRKKVHQEHSESLNKRAEYMEKLTREHMEIYNNNNNNNDDSE